MTRDEAIKRIEEHIRIHGADKGFRARNIQEALNMAVDALKAQEPVKPIFDEGDGKTIGQFLCGKCHAKIGFGHPNFCWYCGRAVKWDD